MALDLSTLTAQQQLAAIYIGYYDRAADPVGEDFWEGAVANPNLSLADIATDFATQPETLAAYPFLNAPSEAEAEGFIAEVFLNLFNRAPDQAGLDFWSDALVGAINGTNSLSVGEIILSIIGGAQNTAEGNDLTTILNKIEVATAWTDAADAAEIDYTSNTAAQNSAKSIIEGVTDAPATVVAAKATIDGFFGGPVGVEGETYFLTSATDVVTGTADDDEFLGYIQQNPFAGGISNSLSSADRLDGGAGSDRLYAELTKEFAGVTSSNESSSRTDISPRLKNIEEIDLEARDDTEDGANPLDTIIVDAKNIVGHDEIGSYYSDGDLTIENLTTKDTSDDGSARNTSEITITMDHTDNFNSDGDASDLTVLFDNDYLLSGQEAEGKIFYFLLDQDAEEDGLEQRLFNIDVDGIRFTIDTGNGPEEVRIEDIAANVAGTHQGFVNALQPRLQELIADGTLPAGTTLTLDPTVTDFTFLDDGSRSDDIPAIVLTSGDGSEVIATGFTRIEEPIGEYNVYGRLRSENQVEDQPISVDLDLHKAGRGGEGGDVVIGGKSENTDEDSIADGIEVININVLGAGDNDPNGGMTKPSNVGTITSTGNELREVIIATDPAFASGGSFASLTVRNGFDQDTVNNVESGDLQLINADAFRGDLTLGDLDAANNAGRITNADTITAQGGGDVELALLLDGNEEDQAYSVTTGAGNDTINMLIDGDALDFAGSSVSISTGGGDDNVLIDFDLEELAGQNEQLNQAILDNVLVETGAGNDTITIDDDAFGRDIGNANIRAGEGNDTVYTDGAANPSGQNAIWAFNFDNVRADAQAGGLSGSVPGDLPGVQTSLAYVGGATVTVTLSGAGLADLAAGGGVMAVAAAGAIAGDDGYEATSTIESLVNGNEYYGDQRDVNAAVIDAINNDDVLGKLLVASMGANNTVVVSSLTSGNFAAIDLRVDINQRDADTDSYANAVLNEAQQVFSNSDLTLTNLWGTTSFVTPANYQATAPGANLTTSPTANAWYDGLSVAGGANSANDNLHTAGTASIYEQDNTIDGGAGDDVIVLSTDAVANAVTPFTLSSNNAFINGASNQTIVLTGNNIGDDTVMNFTTAGTATTVNAGIDFLDFSAYLTSMQNLSAAAGSDSDTLIPVTLDTNTADVQANEVSVVTFDNTDDAGETFAALSSSVIEQLFNNGGGYTGFDGDSSFGSLTAAGANADDEYAETANTDQLINGAAKSILMVENADNDGEYKVFELSWNGDATSDADSTNNGQVSANLLGSIDFGDSLTGLSAANLLGSADYAALLASGLGGAVTPPPGGGGGGGGGGGATVVDLSGQTAVTAAAGTAEVFELTFDSSSGNALSSDAVVSITGFDPAEDILRFDDANATPQAAATFLNGAGGAVVASNGFAGETTISFQDDNAADTIPPAQVTLVGITDATLGGGTPFFEVV